jgi:hypothetical protein
MSAASLNEARKGMVLAARNVGDWPTAATLSEYDAAVERAGLELNRAVACWVRWRRQFNPDPARLELRSGRTNVRYEIARGFFEQRIEDLRLLTGPPEGAA